MADNRCRVEWFLDLPTLLVFGPDDRTIFGHSICVLYWYGSSSFGDVRESGAADGGGAPVDYGIKNQPQEDVASVLSAS